MYNNPETCFLHIRVDFDDHSFSFKVPNNWNGKWSGIIGSRERIRHLGTKNRGWRGNHLLKVDTKTSKRESDM